MHPHACTFKLRGSNSQNFDNNKGTVFSGSTLNSYCDLTLKFNLRSSNFFLGKATYQ